MKRSALEKGFRASSIGFWEEVKCGTKKLGSLNKMQEETKYGDVELETSKKTIVGGGIGRGAKAHKG